MAFTDQQLMNQIQLTMIEPPDSGATWPSGLWTQAEVLDYLNQRQNRLLKDTHLQIGIALIPISSGTDVYDLPDDWINTTRVALQTSTTITELGRSDTWEADHGIPDWYNTQGTPKLYFDGGKPITIRIMPRPDITGTLIIHYTPYAATLDGSPEIVTLPDEFAPLLKYGALSDMFGKVGRGHDATRAAYCQQRYTMGIEIARLLLKGWKK